MRSAISGLTSLPVMYKTIGAVALATTILGLAAVGCSAEAPTENATSSDALSGGGRTAGYPAVGILFAHNGSGSVSASCTATLITANMVLTSASCISSASFDSFYLGTPRALQPNETDWEKAVAGMRKFTITKTEIAPGFVKSATCPSTVADVAVAQLDQSVGDVAPVDVSTDLPAVGSDCTVVGLGRHYSLQGKLLDVFGKREGYVTIDAIRASALKQSSVDDAVPAIGDSGGPLLCDGVLMGVDSCGDGSGHVQTDQYYGRVDVVSSWIQQKINAWTDASDTLTANTYLVEGDSLVSQNGRYKALYDTDGSFGVFDGDNELWSTYTDGTRSNALWLQNDGNVVIYDGGRAVWATGTNGQNGSRLVMQNDGNLVLYTRAGRAVWASQWYSGNGSTQTQVVVKTYVVSNNSRCGFANNGAVCPGSQVCSEWGWCQDSNYVRSDFRCGPDFGNAPCVPGHYCSAWGWCQ